MKRSWLIWLSVNTLLLLYLTAGYLASRSLLIDLKLERGTSTKIELLRVAEGRLNMELQFKGDRRRSELGIYETTSDWKRTGLLKFASPGAAIRLSAAFPDSAPVMYEAMPASSFGSGLVGRNLTSDLSVEPGAWRWPPQHNDLVLHPGFNTIRIDVVSVDPPLSGETVELIVHPMLGFKSTASNVAWLWYWFLWPFVLPLLIVWALLLAAINWRRVL